MVSEKVRLKFFKVGKLKFISHLDLCRTLKGALSRAKVPIKYSEGFNPHPKMVFSLPLPVGAEGLAEYLDITLTEEADEKELMKAINGQMTRELQITEIYKQEDPFSSIHSALYTYTFEDLSKEELEMLLDGRPLPIEKHSKKGIITQDVRPLIYDYTVEKKEDETVFYARLAAGDGAVLNPELLVRAMEKAISHPIEYYSVLRTELLKEDLTPFH